jgi:phospholipid/cholesterol/gamma-HCH transport system substrate-binding protein
MEERREVALQVRVGLFVVISLLVLIGLIYLLGAQARYFEPKDDLVAEFTEVGGLTQGATVRLAGVQIGRVTQVLLPETPGARVRVTLSVARRFRDRIRGDSVARVETQGLLGDKIVEISLGTGAAAPVKPGDTLPSRDPVEVGRLAGEGVGIMRNVAELSERLRATVERFDETKVLEELTAVLRSARRVTGELEKASPRAVEDLAAALGSARRLAERAEKGSKGLEDLEAVLASGRRITERVERITEQVEKGSGWLHALLYEEPEALKRLNAVLAATAELLARGSGDSAVGVLLSAESGRAARQLLQAMEAVGRLAEKGKVEDGLLAALLFDPEYKVLADDLRTVAANFRAVSERLAQGKGIAGSLLQDEGEAGMGQAARDFRAAVANLRAITDRLAAGEGTVGGLLEDPTVYENLAAFLEGAQRSLLLRYLIRSTITSGREKR